MENKYHVFLILACNKIVYRMFHSRTFFIGKCLIKKQFTCILYNELKKQNIKKYRRKQNKLRLL